MPRCALDINNETRDARSVLLLSDALARYASEHPYYRPMLAARKIGRARALSIADFHALPVTTKQDFASDPSAFVLNQPPNASLAERSVWETVFTTGTTSGIPCPVVHTTYDYMALLHHLRHTLRFAPIGGDDVIANLYPLPPIRHAAISRVGDAAAASGASSITFMPGMAHERFKVHRSIESMVTASNGLQKATVLWGMPSFIRKVLSVASEAGVSLELVRYCFVAGEPMTDPLRAEIGRLLSLCGAIDVSIHDRFGATETCIPFVQCGPDGHWHNTCPDYIYCESIDAATGMPVQAGQEGALAVTHLDRRGTALVRYLTGDIVRTTSEPCPNCELAGFQVIGRPHRAKEGPIKIKGTLVSPQAVIDCIARIPGIDEFTCRVEVAESGSALAGDVLIVIVATRASQAAVARGIIAAVQTAVEITPVVRFAPASSIWDPLDHRKPVRFFDARVT